MSKPSVASAHIKKIQSTGVSDADDLLAVEEPLEIRLGYGPAHDRKQKSISVTMRTPGHDFELALGFLFTEGIVQSSNDVAHIRYCTELNTLQEQENIVRVELKEEVQPELDKLDRHFYTSSSCGVCGKASIDAVTVLCPQPLPLMEWQVSRELIFSLPALQRQAQNVFTYTGGLHAAALFNLQGELLLSREDVGRHNALDKLLGAMLQKQAIPLHEHILLLSGRASFELLQKAAVAGISLVCAVGAPSSLAVQVATTFNITLLGFLREQRFNIYTTPERIQSV